jgi:predicted peptidase
MHKPILAVTLALVVGACGASSDINSSLYGGGGNPIDSTPGTGGNVSTGWLDRTVVDAGVTYAFKVFIPANYNSSTTKIPVILFMHGSGNKGSDNVSQTNDGLGPYVKANAGTFPAIVVFPQSPASETGRTIFVRISAAALAKVTTEFTKSDPARVYLTGLSYGATHAWEVAYRDPTRFAAFVPISGDPCGLCITSNSTVTQVQGFQVVAPVLKSMPIWQFQGELDTQVSTPDVRTEVATLKSAGSPIKYTEYAGAGHQIWDTVYASTDMWAWLWAQHR